MASQSDHEPLDIFYCHELLRGETGPKLLQRFVDLGGQPYPVNEQVMKSLSERDTPQGLIVTFSCFDATLPALVTQSEEPVLVLVLDRLQDPGNLGTLVRTADAIAAAGVILVEPCVDLFDPKTVRGSMGSIFNLPIHHTDNPADAFTQLQSYDFRFVAADGYEGQVPWQAEHPVLRGNVGLVLGNEARGLSDDLRALSTDWVRLPMLGQAESLNVSIAGAVLMYQWLQHNRTAA
ncbi:MAG: RNA methyltransferase [Chloroflexota bacterium]